MSQRSERISQLSLLTSSRRRAERGDATRRLDWTSVCPLDRLDPDRGMAALVDGVQVALVRTGGELYAVDNLDPVGGAYVMSRGIVGSRGGVPTLASPLHKQVYDLRTGWCLDLPDVALRRHEVRCRDGQVEVRLRQEE
ncbi:nitrite reductase small subunit NirD [Micromonospora sp. NPDC006431]|uniref:nitrite reductase small subunit NirD n=1 Tax=unclassified Micromonospora TaxID=2617518 RepID=UPI00368311E1